MTDIVTELRVAADYSKNAETLHRAAKEILDLKRETKAKWLPIETAPKDGTDIIVWDGEIRTITSWGKTAHVPIYGWLQVAWGNPEDADLMDPPPLKWMPLPLPPVQQ